MPKEILIVDDEPNVVVPIQFLMEQQGYKVMTAERGEDALDLIYQYKPDLVFFCDGYRGVRKKCKQDGFKGISLPGHAEKSPESIESGDYKPTGSET